MLLTVLTFLSGAKRWVNREALLALAAALTVLVLTLGAAALHGAGVTSGGATAHAAWLGKVNAWNVLQARRKERMAASTAAAEAQARVMAETERDLAVTRAAVLAAEIATMQAKGDDPIVYTLDERRRLFKR